MIFEGKSIVECLVDKECECVDHLIDDNNIEQAVEDYRQLMSMFCFVVRSKYMLDETGLKCRVDAMNIFNLLRARGAFS